MFFYQDAGDCICAITVLLTAGSVRHADDRLGQYEQHDLVQLVDVVGVIVECGADTAKILTSGGRPDRPEICTCACPISRSVPAAAMLSPTISDFSR